MINSFLGKFNIVINKTLPRHSVRFAQNHFLADIVDIVEVGVAGGRNALSMMNELRFGDVYLIDIDITNELKRRLGSSPVIYLEMSSDKAIKYIPMVDFIYIDGDHAYEQVKKDISNYWRKVKKGGILAGHDINSGKSEGVVKAVFEFCSENKLVPYIRGVDWWIVKEVE